MKEANRDSDLGRLEVSEQYKTRIQRKVKRKSLVEIPGSIWKVDPEEYACKIWKWWKPRVDTFPFHALALRLVVLVQLSSFFVERVFSRLKMSNDVCGDNMKEDMNKIR